jgi:hypothetical protein
VLFLLLCRAAIVSIADHMRPLLVSECRTFGRNGVS